MLCEKFKNRHNELPVCKVLLQSNHSVVAECKTCVDDAYLQILLLPLHSSSNLRNLCHQISQLLVLSYVVTHNLTVFSLKLLLDRILGVKRKL
jgi:hypothetical protein